MAGWGRRAVGNAESRLEEDALFKEIGGQLDANFDYDQWQRTRKPAASLQPSKRPSTLDKIASDTVLQNEQFIGLCVIPKITYCSFSIHINQSINN